jgi:hypothetical protein
VSVPHVSPGLTGFWRRLSRLFSRRDLLEGFLVGLAFLLYFAVRGAVIDRPETAYFNALDIVELQRNLGFFWEPDIQEWIKNKLFLVQSANIIYFWLHFPLIVTFGIYLYFKDRRKYTLMRDAFLASGAIALIIYWSYPVAPPRELPELAARFDPDAPAYVLGFIDTMQRYLGYAYQSQSTAAFVNPYAAMPSLHFGWDMLLGIGIVWAFWRQRWMWLMLPIGVVLPAMQVMSITVTANHFFIDALAGAVVAALGIPIAVWLSRWAYPRLKAFIQRLPFPLVRRLILREARSRDEHQEGAGAPQL